MKLKRLSVCALLGISFYANSQITQTVDLSTGIYNGTTNLIPVNGITIDDTWQVKIPGAATFSSIKCATYPMWASDPNTNWISPHVDANGNALSSGTAGYSTYKMTFVAYSCNVSAASLIFNKLGGDNEVTNIAVNSFSHPVSATFSSFNTLTIPLLSSEIISGGLNTILITVRNDGGSGLNPNTPTGLLLNGNLSINYYGDPNLVSHFTGPASVCSGAPMVYNGSSSTGSASNHVWIICECNSSGVPLPGVADWWSPFYPGNPGSYSFPTGPGGPNLQCGKYYLIKLALQGPCDIWKESVKVTRINCTPNAYASDDLTICSGSCTLLSSEEVNPTPGISYVWTSPQGTIATTNQVQVCPTTTTTYTLTETTKAGCSSSDAVTVNVENNPPNFNMASNLNASDNFYTLTGNPVNTNVSGIAGFGFSWIVEEIVSPANTTIISGSQVVNSSCWWSGLSNNFNGYDGVYFTNTGGNPMHLGCGNPTAGKFTAGHTYRITRGTWSTACPWQQYSVIVYMTHAPSGNNIQILEDFNAPDYSNLLSLGASAENFSAEELNVYPNPGTGLFTVETGFTEKTTVDIFDMMGKRIFSAEMNGKYGFDLSGYSKGVYMIKTTVNNKAITKKIILE